MREVQRPFTATHVKDHNNLVSTQEKILDVADKDVLEAFVGYWLVHHITTFDAPFSVYIRRNRVPALMQFVYSVGQWRPAMPGHTRLSPQCQALQVFQALQAA